MGITWIWKLDDTSDEPPAIHDQYISMGSQVLCLRNPKIADSAFMGKMFSATIVITLSLCLLMYWSLLRDSHRLDWALAIPLAFPVIMCLFLAYRIHLIKYQTHFFFNRYTQKVYYRKGKLLQVGEWDKVQAGIYTSREFTGNAVTTSGSLILNVFGTDRNSEQYRLISECWEPVYSILIDSNAPTNPRVGYAGQVWEYIRRFMKEGPDDLPIPCEPFWWYMPQNAICLTPLQALRHYVPWRTGELGERQGKQWWLLPFWLILFPYNMTLALCWWGTCRLFQVRAGEPPAEVFEGESKPLVTIEMANRGIRPYH